jgi:hypothetical protein
VTFVTYEMKHGMLVFGGNAAENQHPNWERVMASVSNPFVDYLSRYTTASPDHEAAFDEFIAQATPPAAGPLRLNTIVERFLQERFARPRPPSVILTGNAGDGKTYLCRQIAQAFNGGTPVDWEEIVDKPLQRDGLALHMIKDLSELGDEKGVEVLQGLAATLGDHQSGERYLIAANEGRLRYLLRQRGELHQLYTAVDIQLRGGPQEEHPDIVVINLTRVTTSAFVPEALAWMTDPAHWAACEACPILARCPVRHNAACLREQHTVGRVQLLYQLLEQLDIHVTVRDMLIHLAYTLMGNRRCDHLQSLVANNEKRSPYAYYENIWGRADDAAFRRKASVVQHLDRLRLGEHSLFEIDDFIVSGGQQPDEQAEHKRVFAPLPDLDERQFTQDRQAYLDGGADSTAAEEEAALSGWLPHCRRKLFFEWRDTNKANRLIPFLYCAQYQRLLRDERGVRDQTLRDLVVGLNRAFARLYLNESDYLYVTTQYLHSGEQPRPLVRLRFPITDMEFESRDLRNNAYNCERHELTLSIAPPAQLRRSANAEQLKPVEWQIGLLQFEYILRLAHGGTYNILAEECELDVRHFKDRLLSSFASAPDKSGQLDFFVAKRDGYGLSKLWIDEHGTIQGSMG